jgi:hypothetical protein
MKSKLVIVRLLSLCLAGISILGFQVTDSQRNAVAAGVHGSVYAQLGLDNGPDSAIVLPAISVFVRDVDSGLVTQEAKTGVDGRYNIEGVAAGRYQLCWKADGWVSDCKPDLILISGSAPRVDTYLDAIGIVPDGQVIMGRVRLGDGGGCKYSNRLFGVEQNALVTALDSSGHIASGPVPANRAGEYVLAGLPRSDVRVRATCGNGSVEARVAAGRFTAGAVTTHDLTLDSLPARFIAMTARLGAQPVKSVSPSATVELEVEVEGRHAGRHLQYRWATSPGFGSIVATDGGQAQWTAPSEPAAGEIHVLISNERGSFTGGGIVMEVGAVELGLAAPLPPAYAEQVVTDGMNPNREYIPPYSGYLKGQNTSKFLTERTNGKDAATDKEATAASYYEIVVGEDYKSPSDCGKGARCTLGGWLKANGWKEDGSPKNGKEARTVFLNNNDLGYVRDMHCLSKNIEPGMESEVACWVTNYSKANQEVPGPPFAFPPTPNAANLASHFRNAEQMDTTVADATVTMEYRKIPKVDARRPVVTFIAYGKPVAGKLKDAPIAEGSDQDGFGDKPVPGMCNNCHGGDDYFGNTKKKPENANVNGRFIVFDLSTFIFSKDAGWTRKDLEQAFKQQNMAVLATQPPPAIKELIEGWYGGPGLPLAAAKDAWTPDPGWKDHEKLYLNVVRACRTCHTALVNQNISWRTYNQFRGQARKLSTRVCGTQGNRDMPHSAISYLNFWRFQPPDLPDYPMGGANPTTTMKQPFLDMGAFLATTTQDIGACKNTKGRPAQ